jgi:hypothetical protein
MQGAGAAYVGPTPSAADLGLVTGALDLDVHGDPDVAGPHSAQLMMAENPARAQGLPPASPDGPQ